MRAAALALAFVMALPIRAQLPGAPSLLDPAGLRLQETSAGVTYLLEETFDSTGYDVAGWTEANATEVKEDWTTAPAPLSGSQSLYFDVSASRTLDSPAFAGQDTVWLSFLFHDNEAALPSAPRVFCAIKDSIGGNNLVTLTIETDGDVTVTSGSATSRSTDSLTLNTTYRIWVSYTKGSGSNAQGAVYWSTDISGAKGSQKAAVTTGTPTGQAVSIRFVGMTDVEWHLDDVLVAATEF